MRRFNADNRLPFSTGKDDGDFKYALYDIFRDIRLSLDELDTAVTNVSSGPIALFSAVRITSNQTSGDTAIFNSTSTLGGFTTSGYSTSTGIFTCPATAKYLFRAQIVTRDSAEASFTESIIAICVGTSAYAFGAAFPDPSQSAEQIPALVTLGPISLASGTEVSIKRVDDLAEAYTAIAFSSTCAVLARAASRFEGWRFT